MSAAIARVRPVAGTLLGPWRPVPAAGVARAALRVAAALLCALVAAALLLGPVLARPAAATAASSGAVDAAQVTGAAGGRAPVQAVGPVGRAPLQVVQEGEGREDAPPGEGTAADEWPGAGVEGGATGPEPTGQPRPDASQRTLDTLVWVGLLVALAVAGAVVVRVWRDVGVDPPLVDLERSPSSDDPPS